MTVEKQNKQKIDVFSTRSYHYFLSGFYLFLPIQNGFHPSLWWVDAGGDSTQSYGVHCALPALLVHGLASSQKNKPHITSISMEYLSDWMPYDSRVTCHGCRLWFSLILQSTPDSITVCSPRGQLVGKLQSLDDVFSDRHVKRQRQVLI